MPLATLDTLTTLTTLTTLDTLTTLTTLATLDTLTTLATRRSSDMSTSRIPSIEDIELSRTHHDSLMQLSRTASMSHGNVMNSISQSRDKHDTEIASHVDITDSISRLSDCHELYQWVM